MPADDTRAAYADFARRLAACVDLPAVRARPVFAEGLAWIRALPS